MMMMVKVMMMKRASNRKHIRVLTMYQAVL